MTTELPPGETPDITTDHLEHRLLAAQRRIDAARAEQLVILAELDRQQVALADGHRSVAEWTSAKLDEPVETCRGLIRTARAIDRATFEALTSGEIGYSRAVEVTRLRIAGADDALDSHWQFDIAGLRRRVAQQRRVTPKDEITSHEDRYLAMQPNLDESSWRLWGQLPGYDGAVVSKALADRADELRVEDVPSTPGQRSADALTSIAMDSLTGSTGDRTGVGNHVTAFVDVTEAAPTQGEQGVRIAGGPRIAGQVLEGMLCDGVFEVLATTSSGQAIDFGSHRTLPPELRRTVLHRDGGACTIEGCSSRYRIEVHHIIPRWQGGDHRPDNLTSLCWWHHHIAIHGLGMTLDPDTPPLRRRLIRAGPDPGG